MKKKELQHLKNLDKIFFSHLLQTPRTASEESFFLEFGAIQMRDYIKERRLNYLHSLANREKSQAVYKVFKDQWSHQLKYDWTEQVKKDMKELNIDFLSLEDLKKIKKETFKKEIKEKIRDNAFSQMMEKKTRLSKLLNLQYKELEIQEYLTDKNMTKEEKTMTFKRQVRMENFGENYRGGREKILCPLCYMHEDSQPKSFSCKTVIEDIHIDGKYEELFSTKIPKGLMQTIKKITSLRKLKSEEV